MRLQTHLRNTFLAGIFAAIPLVVTAFIVVYADTRTRGLFHVDIPFLGVLLAIASIYVLGLIVTSLVGRFFISLIDRILSRLPMLRELYQTWKRISVTPGGTEGMFAYAVLVPLNGLHALGFSSGRTVPGDESTLCVFVPAAPNPTSGRLYFVPKAQCRTLAVTTEEAFQMILSGGNFIPENLASGLKHPPTST